MKSIGLLIIFSLTLFQVALSQNIPVRTLPTEIFRSINKNITDTSKWRWKRGGAINANLGQGSLSNWSAGGDNFSMVVTTYFNYYLLHRKGKHTWDNNLDFFFGYVQTTSLGSRKNDDRVDFVSKYGYTVDSSRKWYISGLYNFRTQLFDGLTYVTRDSGILNSTFLSPAYTLLSAGMDYKPNSDFSLFLSPLTSRWVLVASKRLYKDGAYGVPKGRRIINEMGAFASLNYTKTIWKNVSYKGRMDLFSNYRSNPLNTDIYFTNFVTFKINKYLSASYNLDMIYDDDVKLFGPNKNSPGLQLKSLIGIGFLMNFAAK
ncbi:DUF3078 domain-containing protein [Foetidibacter luteolus]|uniref:DUF3078 domain-containing protein n=1 Tax=Foetidibacter luteolus TaxID=2608880 RepID=UPI00129A1054|nr:DUF3078 domain-containing protein [Foetidibacter luteolus]